MFCAAVAFLLAPHITTPTQQFGHALGDDYFLANYKQLTEYWTKLDRESDRIQVVPIGKTEEGRTQLMAVISDPANIAKLARYKEIARRLCLAKGLTDGQATALAREGKSVVWIDGGLHASEVLGAQQLMETVYQLVSRDDEETRRLLRDDIVLCVLANPDGQDLCADWYMRNADPTKRSLANLPRLYQKYIGHDDNRDFYASNMAETTNMNRVLYKEWFPQIVYNHHQTGPAGTVLFQPPFRDPFNYHYDPLVISELDEVGGAMMSRFISENKPGATIRSGAPYSTWFNGSLRTTSYFHNMIGILTETIGSPTPMRIPFNPDRLLPKGDLPFPIQPQEWHFRQSIDYMITANYAVLDFASRHREQLLMNIYRMGKNSIDKGSRDTWTDTPPRIALGKDKGYPAMRAPELRDPRAYILPTSQDPGIRSRFVNMLLKNGVEVQQAMGSFRAGEKTYDPGTYVVRCDQAFRPHILDMFEPQDHPNDLQYPGGPPIPPYDAAGYTPAFQMGLKFDRILDEAPRGSFRTITDPVALPPGSVTSPQTVPGGVADRTPLIFSLTNNAYTAIVRLLKMGAHPSLTAEGVSVKGASLPELEKVAKDLALEIGWPAPGVPQTNVPLRMPRVALWDRYGGSMPSGWIRWILEQYEIPFTVLYPPDIDSGISGKYDVLILPSDATIGGGRGAGGGDSADAPGAPRQGPDPESIPAEYRSRLGSLSLASSVPKLREFVERGGTILAIGPATRIGSQLGLDLKSALLDDQGKALTRSQFYVPGSVTRVHVDNSQPIAWGMPLEFDVMFEDDPAWIAGSGVDRIAWYADASPLRSGWALGQPYLKDTAAITHAKLGKGNVYLFAPEITYRAQSDGTFKLLFNGIFLSAAATP